MEVGGETMMWYEDIVTSQGMQATSGAKNGNDRFSSSVSRRNQAWQHLHFNPLKLFLDFWPAELDENKYVLL